MGASMATVNALAKDVFGPRVVNQLDNTNTLTKRIEKTSRGTESHQGGKFVTFPLKVRRNQGIGYRNELEKLQKAGQQGYASVRVPLRYGYGRVHMSGQTMDLVNENYQAFASAMTEEMDGLRDDIAKDTNRVLWGDGSGTLGVLDTAAAATNVLSFGDDFEQIKWFQLDMQVDIVDPTDGTIKAADRKVVDINESTGDITLDGAAVTAAVGDVAVRTGNFNREPNGLESLVRDSGELFGLDAADEPLWKSIVDNTGGALSEVKMTEICDRLRQKGERPTVIFTDLTTRRAYFSLLKQERRFTDTKTFEGGFKGLAFTYEDEIPLVTDIDAPAGKMWFLDEKAFTIYRRKPWSWEDKDGNVWKWVTDYDAWEAVMKQYWEFALDKRKSQAVMTGITG